LPVGEGKEIIAPASFGAVATLSGTIDENCWNPIRLLRGVMRRP
jgi:hypothetical protein